MPADLRRHNLFTAIANSGGRIRRSESAGLGRACGYDPRALGGFFRGADAPLRIEGDEIVLTDAGKRGLDRYGRSQ
jgi:hypothetical protein